MSHTVSIQDLKVGMYVHLDMAWMSHPFPLSSFRISSEQQIDTIRGLGLRQVRWVPERSELPCDGSEAAPAVSHPDEVAPESPAQAQARQRREALVRQREIALVCERQYEEAGQSWRRVFDRVQAQPIQAREDTEALTQALLDKMLVDGELCVRVLNAAAGDRATAHAMNVAVVSMLMGRTFGIEGQEMIDLGVGALMHDVGKLDLPERLRHFDDRFNSSELQNYRGHVDLGLQQAGRMQMSAGAMQIVAQHHECADGSGFPQGIANDRMSALARIVALVNRFDNLCNPGVLSRALTPHEALSTMFAQLRSKFDATMLNSFIRMMGVYPAGSVVQLTDDRYALVVSVNSMRPLKPCVLVHDPGVPRDEALHLDLQAVPELGIRRSIRAAQLPPDALDYLAPRPRLAYFFEAAARVPQPEPEEEFE